ncbi:ANF_receptor domain-containing protein [Trichonephila clavipes]|nr:ANF_receptor domain-containing protein [Trichonephila clavipes]
MKVSFLYSTEPDGSFREVSRTIVSALDDAGIQIKFLGTWSYIYHHGYGENPFDKLVEQSYQESRSKYSMLLCHGSVNILSINRLNVYHPPYTTEFIWIRRELTARVDYELISVPSKLSLPQDTKIVEFLPPPLIFNLTVNRLISSIQSLLKFIYVKVNNFEIEGFNS